MFKVCRRNAVRKAAVYPLEQYAMFTRLYYSFVGFHESPRCNTYACFPFTA